MPTWESYPVDYRQSEINTIVSCVSSGECAAVIGLSGSGKSNLLGYLANRILPSQQSLRFILIDCNRLIEESRSAFFDMLMKGIGSSQPQTRCSTEQALTMLEDYLRSYFEGGQKLCFLFDRFDTLYSWQDFSILASNLRALRDDHKYQLTYIVAARRPISQHTELSELFFGHTIWLGPLIKKDALWSARRDARRYTESGSAKWDEAEIEKLVNLSGGYPSLLRAVCEAYASGAQLEIHSMSEHPAVAQRVAEFWADEPSCEALRLSGLEEQPLLKDGRKHHSIGPGIDPSELTAKEHQLLEYFKKHIGEVCSKDDLVHAVWPEDVIFEQGVRDESLAQLIRRLRVKIEPNPTEPSFIQTVPGRGYLFRS